MDFRRTCLTLVVAGLALAAGAAPSRALTPGTRAALPQRVARPAKALALDITRRIDINNINMFLTNYGSYAWDLHTGLAGLIFPKGTGKTAVFAAGIWFGASVNGQIRTVVAEYSQEYGPGVILPDGSWDDPANPNYKVYKVARYTGNPLDTANVQRSASDLLADPQADPLVHHSWSEYIFGAVPYGAPWKNYRFPSPENPADTLDIPGPDILGDQMCWAVYNDADPGNHTNEAGRSAPLDLQVKQTTFAFSRTGALGNTIFLKFEITHPLIASPPVGTAFGDTLQDMFVSLWMDPDLGGATDDLVGCDTTLSLGICYNGDNNDQIYGTTPPALGYNFFLGPLRHAFPGDTTRLRMTSFNKYINGTDPATTQQTYNYMQGLNRDGTIVIDPTTGLPTTFTNPGDPVAGTGWLDDNPADKRMMLSSGPFTMAPGDTQIVVGAIVMGQGSDRLASVTGLKFFDKSAAQAFDFNFNLPPPPPQPTVTANISQGQVQLCWDSRAQFGYQAPAGYAFEGYNVYQGSSVAGPWKRLVTYDLVDGIQVVRDTVFDTNTGQLITDFPVAFGGDNGISYCYTATQDAITGNALRDGTAYYYAVTAYSVGLGKEPKVLEDPQVPIQVLIQRPASGTDPSTATPLCPQYVRANASIPQTTDVIGLKVVDPAAVTGDTYAVTYSALPRDTVIGADTVSVGWNVVDLTTGTTKLTNQVNKSGDNNYQVVDGIQVSLTGSYTPTLALNTVNYYGAACPVFAENNPPLSGVDAGLGFFGGGADVAFNFFTGIDPSAQPDLFTTVEVRFSHTNTQMAHRYFRYEKASTGGAPPQGRGYAYAGFHPQPFTVWDTQNNIQLNVGFLERCFTADDGTILPLADQPASQDSLWDPTTENSSGSNPGGREYLFISHRPYTGSPDPNLAVDNAPGGVASPPPDTLWEYSAWLFKTSAAQNIQDGDVFRFTWGFVPGTANDTIKFGTTPLVRGNLALEKKGLSSIRVVPNPYYNRSRYELNQFNRVMRFINMPEIATVRIYNLSGRLVRTLRKTDPTSSILNWDLLTDNGLPVASGVYVYHIEAPGAGSTVGRLVVFMEKERLNTL